MTLNDLTNFRLLFHLISSSHLSLLSSHPLFLTLSHLTVLSACFHFPSFTFSLNHLHHLALLFSKPLPACILRCKMDEHNKSIYPSTPAFIPPPSSPDPSLLYSLRGESRRCLPFIIYFHPFVQLLSAVTHVRTRRHTHI